MRGQQEALGRRRSAASAASGDSDAPHIFVSSGQVHTACALHWRHHVSCIAAHLREACVASDRAARVEVHRDAVHDAHSVKPEA